MYTFIIYYNNRIEEITATTAVYEAVCLIVYTMIGKQVVKEDYKNGLYFHWISQLYELIFVAYEAS